MLDGLNECFVAHPVFQGLGIAGGVMGLVYGVQPVQWAGVGLQVAAGVTSGATSYARTRAYVKEINRDLLHLAALHMNIMTTKKMMEKVGYPEDKLQLPPLDIPDTEALKQSAPQTDEASDKHAADAVSRRQAKGDFKVKQVSADLERNQAHLEQLKLSNDGSQNAMKLEKEAEKENVKLNKRLAKTQAKADRKIDKSLAKVDSKTEKVDKKENKIANKVRWIVLTRWTGDAPDDSDEDSALESE